MSLLCGLAAAAADLFFEELLESLIVFGDFSEVHPSIAVPVDLRDDHLYSSTDPLSSQDDPRIASAAHDDMQNSFFEFQFLQHGPASGLFDSQDDLFVSAASHDDLLNSFSEPQHWQHNPLDLQFRPLDLVTARVVLQNGPLDSFSEPQNLQHGRLAYSSGFDDLQDGPFSEPLY
jgi:hypothetical protein